MINSKIMKLISWPMAFPALAVLPTWKKELLSSTRNPTYDHISWRYLCSLSLIHLLISLCLKSENQPEPAILVLTLKKFYTAPMDATFVSQLKSLHSSSTVLSVDISIALNRLVHRYPLNATYIQPPDFLHNPFFASVPAYQPIFLLTNFHPLPFF